MGLCNENKYKTKPVGQALWHGSRLFNHDVRCLKEADYKRSNIWSYSFRVFSYHFRWICFIWVDSEAKVPWPKFVVEWSYTTHSNLERGERESEKGEREGVRVSYNIKRHASKDLLSPTRHYLLIVHSVWTNQWWSHHWNHLHGLVTSKD